MKHLALKIFTVLFVVLGTLLVIFYARGYRFSLAENIFFQTGILHIETQPTRANYWLTEDFTGTTPRIVTSIPEGEYVLDVWLDGYHSIKYDIEIFAEKSTPISVLLFKKEPEQEIVETLEKNILEIHTGDSRNETLLLAETKNNETKEYEIIRYQTNTRFWQFGENPSTLFSFSLNNESDMEEISFSPNNKNILLTISGEEKDDDNDEFLETGKHLISLDTKTFLAKGLDIHDSAKWSQDGESLVWEDEEGIHKLNLKEPEKPVLVYSPPEDTEILHFDSYTNGEIYMLLETEESPYVSLSRVSEDLEKGFLIEKIYYQNEDRFLSDLREKDTIRYRSFTNSPQSTLFVGKPYKFSLSGENQTIVFKTEFASYLYDIRENRYVLINPYETEILGFSPDNRKIAFLSLENRKLGFFRFDKEISNYSIELGGRYLDSNIDRERCSDFAWHNNSQNLFYTCTNSLYVSDIKAKDNIQIIENFGEKILPQNQDKVITFFDEEEFNIVEFTIN